jgi:hypothetical protein
MRTVLTQQQIEQRLPVWHALSDLFLDTQLQPVDHERIANVLCRSGYSVEELRAILDEEVAPAFVFNLLDIAGEWAGWHEEEVQEIMLRSLQSGRGLPPMRWLRKRFLRKHLDDEWASILAATDREAAPKNPRQRRAHSPPSARCG